MHSLNNPQDLPWSLISGNHAAKNSHMLWWNWICANLYRYTYMYLHNTCRTGIFCGQLSHAASHCDNCDNLTVITACSLDYQACTVIINLGSNQHVWRFFHELVTISMFTSKKPTSIPKSWFNHEVNCAHSTWLATGWWEKTLLRYSIEYSCRQPS